MDNLTGLLITLRWTCLVILAPLIYLFGIKLSIFYSPVCVYVLGVLTVVLALANVGFHVWYRWYEDYQRQMMVQMVLDFVVISILLHYAGGLTNPLYILFVLHVIIAARSFNLWQTLALTTLVSALVILFGLGEFYGGMMHHSLDLGSGHATSRLTEVMIQNPYYVTARIGSLVVIFYGAAFLTRYHGSNAR